jgi:3-hydroxybutyryl-CoA dehydrogenase
VSEAVQPPTRIGVVGAGTMGSGIAQLACRFANTLLYDPVPEALERGLLRAREGLVKEAAKGTLSEEQAASAAARLHAALPGLDALADCELVIEAAPERPDIKRELFAELCEVVSKDCVLATNTSSLPVTGIASAATHPERVVGMHFFNPAPLMRLVEVIAGVRSAQRAIELAHAAGEAMGKTVIRATDGPGFLVNRCNRPFLLEGLKLLAEQVADLPSIDRICRLEGGFRMGPFELSDLVGLDTGLDVSRSFYELSFGEPRWRPSALHARQVAAGLTGRKAGRGWYDYRGEGAHREADPEAPAPAPPINGEAIVVISGEGTLADELRDAAATAGYEVRGPAQPSHGDLPALIVRCDAEEQHAPPPPSNHGHERGHAHERASLPAHAAERVAHGAPELVLCAAGSLAALDAGGAAAGFHVVGPLAGVKLVELTRTSGTSPLAAARGQRFFEALGRHVCWVADCPGLVLGRIVSQLVNECAFALGEGVGSAKDIDDGMLLGLNHPRGPLAWGDEIGLDHVLTVLDALWAERREERYRAAPRLRALVLEGRTGKRAGAGFFEYESADASV